MAFPTSSTASATNGAAHSAVASATVANTPTAAPLYVPPTAQASAPAAAATVVQQVTTVKPADMESMLNGLKLRLAQNSAITEPKDITLEALRSAASELANAIAQATQYLGFTAEPTDSALRFLPERHDEEKGLKPAALYFLSLASDGKGSCSVRWGNKTIDFDGGDGIFNAGIRILEKQAYLIAGNVKAPVGLITKELSEGAAKNMALATTFGELSEYLAQGGGSILSEYHEGFMMALFGAEAKVSKKGNTYLVLHGAELNAQSQPAGDVSIFSPGNKGEQYWADKGGAVILVYDDQAKSFNVLASATGEQIDNIPLRTKTAKLKELAVGDSFEMIGCELIEYEGRKSWVVKLRKAGGEMFSCYTNTRLREMFDVGADQVLASAGRDASDLSQILKLSCADHPFGTLTVLGQRSNSNGVIVDLDIQLAKTKAQAAEETDFFASLGIV